MGVSAGAYAPGMGREYGSFPLYDDYEDEADADKRSITGITLNRNCEAKERFFNPNTHPNSGLQATWRFAPRQRVPKSNTRGVPNVPFMDVRVRAFQPIA